MLTPNLKELVDVNAKALDGPTMKAELIIINLIVDYHSFFYMN